MEQIAIRVKKGTKDQWEEAAEKSGLSLARFIQEAVAEKISGMENVPESNSENPSGDAPMRMF